MCLTLTLMVKTMSNNSLDKITKGLQERSKGEPAKEQSSSIDLKKVAESVKQVNGKPFYTPKYIQFFYGNDDNQ